MSEEQVDFLFDELDSQRVNLVKIADLRDLFIDQGNDSSYILSQADD